MHRQLKKKRMKYNAIQAKHFAKMQTRKRKDRGRDMTSKQADRQTDRQACGETDEMAQAVLSSALPYPARVGQPRGAAAAARCL
jgi:hypothetical protein